MGVVIPGTLGHLLTFAGYAGGAQLCRLNVAKTPRGMNLWILGLPFLQRVDAVFDTSGPQMFISPLPWGTNKPAASAVLSAIATADLGSAIGGLAGLCFASLLALGMTMLSRARR